ncbi:ribokinase [Streptomyces sp. HPF1205]|uniref:ribokinase n=1 Tax=Streptomyces sp. HPF1205 TaxID=2873262 RepID=UPI001CEC7D0F|nr:ribokinase [Streptomyces sp. HPF1205]
MDGAALDGKTLLVIGSANADLVVGVGRHPAPGETVLGLRDLAVHPGGKGANQAVAAGRLGARVAFCGRVGRDTYGDMLAAVLREAGVGTAALRGTRDAPTGVALITVAESGENTVVVAPGANATLTAEEAEAAITPDVRVVSAQCEVPAAVIRAAARRAPRLVLNPSPPEALVGVPYAAEILSHADPLVVNEHELRVLLSAPPAGRDRPDPRPEIPRPEDFRPEDLLLLGVRSAVVTLGAAGAVVVERAGAAGPGPRTTRVPAPAVVAVDTTGAGDAFTGALAWRLAEGDGLVAAAGWAVRVGAAAVQEHGAQLSSTACGKLPELPDGL